MPIQLGKHDVHKLNVSTINKVIAGNNMPSTMTVMTFSTLADIDRGLHLKTDAFTFVAFFEY